MVLSLLIGYIPISGGRAIFDCNFNKRDLNLASHVPKFYRDILTVWMELHSKNPSTAKDYQNETIWNNRFIRIDGKPAFYSSRVIKIHNLLNESRNLFIKIRVSTKTWYVSRLSNV